MKTLLKIIVLILTIGCNQTVKKEFETPLITKYFSASDTKELAHIVAYVDSLVLANNQFTEIDKAYHYYLDSVYLAAKNGQMDALAFDQEQKYAFLFALDTTLFSKVWSKSTSSEIVKTNDTILFNPEGFTTINLKLDGEFVKMIANLGNENDYYSQLSNAIEVTGGLSPTAISQFLNSHKELNFKDQHNRLWIAIFLLTIEEPLEMRVQRFLGQ